MKEMAKHHIRRDWSTKLAIGLIQCRDYNAAKLIPWQECKFPVGQLPSLNSWSFLATGNLRLESRNSGIGNEFEYGGIAGIQAGDRIGMLVDFDANGSACVSFFCNSLDLGVAFDKVPGPLLPVVSVCDRFHIFLKFPPPPYSKRNPRLTLLSSGSSSTALV